MRRFARGVLLLLALAGTWQMVAAQQPGRQQGSYNNSSQAYRPVYQAPVYTGGGGYYGWGGGGAGTTVAGSYMQGMASVISSAGQANLANSAAANNWENAYTLDLNNRLLATETYFEQRRLNKEATTQERGPHVTEAELVRFAKDAAPPRLTASQLDPVTGEVAWPTALRAAAYAPARERVDQLFTARENSAGAIGPAGYRKIKEAIQGLRAQLTKNISDYSPQIYLESRNFLESLEYEASFAG